MSRAARERQIDDDSPLTVPRVTRQCDTHNFRTRMGGLDLETIASRISSLPAPRGDAPRAAVAAVLRAGTTGPEILFIERAKREGDPWSGHMAFPGGRRDDA